MFGYKKSDLIGINYLAMNAYFQESIPLLKKRKEKIDKGNSLKPLEIQLLKKNGNLIWVKVNSSLLKLNTGTYIQCVIQNITDKKEQELKLRESKENLKILEQKVKKRTKELKESEEKYKILFNSGGDAVFVWRVTKDGRPSRFFEVNDIACQRYGYTREEFLNLAPGDIDTPKKFGIAPNFMKNLISEKYILFELVNVTKTGKKLPVEINSHLFEFGGEPTVISVVRDITERKKAEQKLKESEEKYRLISENANDLIRVFNDKIEVEYINEFAHLKLIGYSKEDLIGKFGRKLIHPDELGQVIRLIKKALITGEFRREGRIRHKNGQWIWFDIKGITFRDDDGNRKLLIISRDITERIKIELNLKKSEEKYREAYNRVNFYKDLFTHDMNNILQNISSSGELLSLYIKNPEKFKEMDEILRIMKNQVKRGAKLILNVQKLSKLEETHIKTQLTEIFNVLKNALENVKNGFKERKINMVMDSTIKQIYVQANELLIDIFENILINCIRHNDNSIVEILIRVTEIQKERNNFLKLEFIDNGRGIPNNRKEVIFRRTTEEGITGRGMGLGLSLVKKIITSYNGEIWVEDRIQGDYSKGSNFIVLIPKVS